jgi:hypothetical protein
MCTFSCRYSHQSGTTLNCQRTCISSPIIGSTYRRIGLAKGIGEHRFGVSTRRSTPCNRHRPDRDAEAAKYKARIYRRLDGIPLAIELAVANIAVLGAKGVADRLDDRLTFLTKGRRAVPPRQQTLRRTFDWSYDLLPPPERVVFASRLTRLVVAAYLREAIFASSGNTDLLWSR